MRSTSAVLRPVEAGYERIVRTFLAGSMMKTERIVKAMPFSSTLVASWWSILCGEFGGVELSVYVSSNSCDHCATVVVDGRRTAMTVWMSV